MVVETGSSAWRLLQSLEISSPFEISTLSQALISLARLVNSRTRSSKSEDHRFIMSSSVMPFRSEGTGTDILDCEAGPRLNEFDVALELEASGAAPVPEVADDEAAPNENVGFGGFAGAAVVEAMEGWRAEGLADAAVSAAAGAGAVAAFVGLPKLNPWGAGLVAGDEIFPFTKGVSGAFEPKLKPPVPEAAGAEEGVGAAGAEVPVSAPPPNLNPLNGLLGAEAGVAAFLPAAASSFGTSLFSVEGFGAPNENPEVNPPVVGAAGALKMDDEVEDKIELEVEGAGAGAGADVRGLAGGLPNAKVVGGGFEAGVVVLALVFALPRPPRPPKGLGVDEALLLAALLPNEKPDGAEGAVEGCDWAVLLVPIPLLLL